MPGTCQAPRKTRGELARGPGAGEILVGPFGIVFVEVDRLPTYRRLSFVWTWQASAAVTALQVDLRQQVRVDAGERPPVPGQPGAEIVSGSAVPGSAVPGTWQAPRNYPVEADGDHCRSETGGRPVTPRGALGAASARRFADARRAPRGE